MNISSPKKVRRKVSSGDAGALGNQTGHDGAQASALEASLSRLIEQDDLRRLEMAKKLHRDVAGNLVACTALSEMIRSQGGRSEGVPSQTNAALLQIDAALRDTLQLVRDLAEEQFPPVLNAFGLGAAMQQLIRNLAQGFNGALLLHVGEGELTLEPARRLNLFRMIQIIVQRCITHSKATVIEVTCAPSNGHIECVIDHDGRADLWGYDQGDEEFAMLQARKRLLGCTLDTSASPTNQNPRIEIVIPCRAKGG